MICCPITTKVKDYPFETALPKGLEVEGVILSDQVKSLDWKVRDIKFMCKVPTKTTIEVLAKLNTLLDIT